jgi:hypothetical protein
LIAAAAALLALARVIVATGGTDLARALRVREWRTALRFWAVSVVIALVVLWIATRVLPARVFAEALTNQGAADFTAGGREGSAFGEGWSPVLPAGNVRMRAALAEGVLNIPLPDRNEYVATLRLDPFPRPMSVSPARLPVLDLVLNGTAIGKVALLWNPDRVGAYNIVLPVELVRRGNNRLVLRLEQTHAAEEAGIGQRLPGLTDGDTFVLWYVRLNRSQR